jgi:hypothetical protein
MSLNLAVNGLGVEGAKVVAEAIKVKKCVVAVVLVPTGYSFSDH